MMGGRPWRGMHHGERYFALRWILGVAILVIVFAAGFKLAEFREDIANMGYGGGMWHGCDGEPGYGMLQRRGDAVLYRYGMMRASGTEAPSAAQGR